MSTFSPEPWQAISHARCVCVYVFVCVCVSVSVPRPGRVQLWDSGGAPWGTALRLHCPGPHRLHRPAAPEEEAEEEEGQTDGRAGEEEASVRTGMERTCTLLEYLHFRGQGILLF